MNFLHSKACKFTIVPALIVTGLILVSLRAQQPAQQGATIAPIRHAPIGIVGRLRPCAVTQFLRAPHNAWKELNIDFAFHFAN
jgi:hypothetical protein